MKTNFLIRLQYVARKRSRALSLSRSSKKRDQNRPGLATIKLLPKSKPSFSSKAFVTRRIKLRRFWYLDYPFESNARNIGKKILVHRVTFQIQC
jgi:hypothetical protein